MATAMLDHSSSNRMIASAPASLQTGPRIAIAPLSTVITVHTIFDDNDNDELLLAKRDVHCDLELHLLRAFGAFVSDTLLSSYDAVKHSSRIAAMVAHTTERLVTRTGIAAVVHMLFAQFQRVAQPWLSAADDAMGTRVIDVLVRVLLLAKVHDTCEKPALETDSAAAAGYSSELLALGRLSYPERVHALLQGDLPRIQALLHAAHCRERDARMQHEQELAAAVAAAQPPAPAPVVMDLSDFVPLDDVKRMTEAHSAVVSEKNSELVALHEQLRALEREKQRLEQDLTDVHSYQASERGQRFQEMEEELARTKLEANQKAYHLRKLELVVESLRSRKRKSSKSAKSDAGKSTTTASEGGDDSSLGNNVSSA